MVAFVSLHSDGVGQMFGLHIIDNTLEVLRMFRMKSGRCGARSRCDPQTYFTLPSRHDDPRILQPPRNVVIAQFVQLAVEDWG